METGEGTIQQSRFEALPGELRKRIYRLVVVEEAPVKVVAWFLAEDHRGGFRQPALSVVSHQMRGEVLSIYYAENTFVMDAIPSGEFDYTCLYYPAIEKFRHRARTWVRSCSLYAFSIVKVGVATNFFGNPSAHSIVADIIRRPTEPKDIFGLRNGDVGNCTCMLRLYCVSRSRLTYINASSVSIALDGCRKQLPYILESVGEFCPRCGGEHPPSHR